MNSFSSDPSARPRVVAVIGGGATGLAAAFRLTQLGYRVRLFEASRRLGGVVRTEAVDGWTIEVGPNSLLENSHEVVALISELGLDNERVVAAPAARHRFIVRDGKLVALPLSPPALLTSSLLSWRSKLKLPREFFTRPQKRATDVSLANLIRAHFGEEVVDYLLNPFVSGVYAGNSEKLSAQFAFPTLWEAERTTGSLLRGQLAQAKVRRARGEPKSRIVSFRRGLQSLTDALAGQLSAGTVEFEAKVEAILPGNRWRLRWSRDGVTETEEFGAVVVAVPGPALARLSFGANNAQPLAELDRLEYPPVASLFLGFRRQDVAHPLDGFGALIPAKEKRALLGVLFSSTLFPERAPAGHVALTVLAGGANRPELAQLPERELATRTLAELRELLGVSGAPVFSRFHMWPQAIPQYNLGHERFIEAIVACEQRHPGVFIGGQVRDGISLPACLSAGLQLAQKAAQALAG